MSKWSAAFRDSRWQKLRLEIMERDKWTCKSCGACGEGVTLNVHHAYYESGRAPWEYPKQTLVTYCENCHKERHELQKWLAKELIRRPIKFLAAVLSSCTNYEKSINMLHRFSEIGISDESIETLLL